MIVIIRAYSSIVNYHQAMLMVDEVEQIMDPVLD